MEELIFIAIIIFFSIIDSIARSRKAKQAGKQVPRAPQRPVPTRAQGRWQDDERPARETVPTGDAAPTYDPMPTYDDQATYDSEPTHDDRESGASSAGMIPSDLWEEIAGLATGSRAPQKAEPAPPRPAPTRPAPPRPAPAKPLPAKPLPAKRTPASKTPVEPATWLPSPAPTGTAPEVHPIHLTHAQYGTDPSQRTRSPLDAIPSRAGVSADVRAVRTQLGGGAHSLRRAIILHEVLGPPAGLSSDRIAD